MPIAQQNKSLSPALSVRGDPGAVVWYVEIASREFHHRVWSKQFQYPQLRDSPAIIRLFRYQCEQVTIDLDFREEFFDIIWAEGSIFIIGFENGLKVWKKFIKKWLSSSSRDDLA